MDGHRWALVVGACDYEFHPSLQFAASDAVEFADALVSSLGFDRKRVLVVADGDVADYPPTRRNIFHTLGLLSDEHSALFRERNVDPMDENDQFVFYYSGHGIRRNRDEFLLPIDTSNYAITETAVPLETVVERIEKLPSRHKVLFLDACREQFYPDDGAKAIGGAKGIGQKGIVDREGLATFYSCDPGQLSYEIESLQHGSFTYCLLEAVKHPGINTLGELDEFLKSRVPQENKKAEKTLQQPFSVPNPSDMLDVSLFRLVRAPSDREQLIDMTSELFDKGVFDIDWWQKLCNIWEAGDAPYFELKRAIFERLYEEKDSVAEFHANWRRTERHAPSTTASKPDLPFPQPAP
jgi:uncharacterized caspase-like protein